MKREECIKEASYKITAGKLAKYFGGLNENTTINFRIEDIILKTKIIMEENDNVTTVELVLSEDSMDKLSDKIGFVVYTY